MHAENPRPDSFPLFHAPRIFGHELMNVKQEDETAYNLPAVLKVARSHGRNVSVCLVAAVVT
jgi:hypothetical protein